MQAIVTMMIVSERKFATGSAALCLSLVATKCSNCTDKYVN